MKEIREIISSYDVLQSQGKRAALATVVHVEGSSYRRPGARMLIAEDGGLTGAISGGCLEGDAMRKALLVINENKPALITYDTMGEDDATIGIGLGCNGIIKILIEPINNTDINNPIHLLKHINTDRQEGVVATYYSLQNKKYPQAGTKFLIKKSLWCKGIGNEMPNEDYIMSLTESIFTDRKNEWLDFEEEQYSVFLQYIPPAIKLVIIGAGNDVQPLVEMAYILGWDTMVADGRTNYARRERFAKACDVIVAKPGQVLDNIAIDDYTCFALMTHNYNYDKAMLIELRKHKVSYVAMLGPKKKFERMLVELDAEGSPLPAALIDVTHSPAGLEIGAETSEDIALSIIAEIKAVMSQRCGQALKMKTVGIHE